DVKQRQVIPLVGSVDRDFHAESPVGEHLDKLDSELSLIGEDELALSARLECELRAIEELHRLEGVKGRTRERREIAKRRIDRSGLFLREDDEDIGLV